MIKPPGGERNHKPLVVYFKKGKRLRNFVYYQFKFTLDENYQESLGGPFKSKWQGGGKKRQQMDRAETIKDLGKEKVLFGQSFLRGGQQRQWPWLPAQQTDRLEECVPGAVSTLNSVNSNSNSSNPEANLRIFK